MISSKRDSSALYFMSSSHTNAPIFLFWSTANSLSYEEVSLDSMEEEVHWQRGASKEWVQVRVNLNPNPGLTLTLTLGVNLGVRVISTDDQQRASLTHLKLSRSCRFRTRLSAFRYTLFWDCDT